MAKSIISGEYECYICGTIEDLHRHHIFNGSGIRPLSEKNGCWVYLCARHHNMSKYGVHTNRELDLQIKRICQKKLEESGWSREEFIKTFGRNYDV